MNPWEITERIKGSFVTLSHCSAKSANLPPTGPELSVFRKGKSEPGPRSAPICAGASSGVTPSPGGGTPSTGIETRGVMEASRPKVSSPISLRTRNGTLCGTEGSAKRPRGKKMPRGLKWSQLPNYFRSPLIHSDFPIHRVQNMVIKKIGTANR